MKKTLSLLLSLVCCLNGFSYNGMNLFAETNEIDSTRGPVSEVALYGVCDGGKVVEVYMGYLETRGQIVQEGQYTTLFEFYQDLWFDDLSGYKRVVYLYVDSYGYQYNALMLNSGFSTAISGDFGPCIDINL